MRASIVLYLNGKRHELSEEQAFMTVSDYLRYVKGLTGTKVVCAEGDCGACTILVSRMTDRKLTPYKAINSCISFMYLLDLCHVITVEGLKKNEVMHPVQTAMVAANGAQCGYCTPGFICAMASLTEDAKNENFALSPKRVKNYLTGNLCRCTGYDAIIEAGCAVNLETVPALGSMYDDSAIEADLQQLAEQSVSLKKDHLEIHLPHTIGEAVNLRASMSGLRMKSGSTDLGVLHNKGKIKLGQMMSLTHVSDLYRVVDDGNFIVVGARASLDQVERSTAQVFKAFSDYLHIFASAQIKNSGTLVGNLVNASPIGDTIPFLRVAEAIVVLNSTAGEREVNINSFIKGGYKELDVRTGELVTHVKIPKTSARFKLFKVSTRKDLDISTVTFAARFKIENGKFTEFALALGGVGPTVLRMTQIEARALGQTLDLKLFQALALEIGQTIKPLSDVRGTADYRRMLCQNLMLKFGDELMRELNPVLTEASV